MASRRGRDGGAWGAWARWFGRAQEVTAQADADRWIAVGRTEDFVRGGLVEARVGDGWVVVGRAGEAWFALDAVCPHAGGDLAKGHLEGSALVCPLHAWRFDVATGRCEIGGHVAQVHGVRVVAGEVQVRSARALRDDGPSSAPEAGGV